MDIARLAEKIRAEKAAALTDENIDFYNYNKRESVSLADGKIGGSAVPAVATFGKSKDADFQFENGTAAIDGAKKILVKKYASAEELSADIKRYDTVAAEIATGRHRKICRCGKKRQRGFCSARARRRKTRGWRSENVCGGAEKAFA